MKDNQNANAALALLEEPTTSELEGEVGELMGERKTRPAPVIRGTWSPAALTSFVTAVNRAAALFAVEPVVLPDTAISELPSDIANIVGLIASAINDAVADDVLPAELAFSPESLTSDAALTAVAGKIGKAISTQGFRRWLKEKPEPAPESEDEAINVDVDLSVDGEEEENEDELFASRM